MKTTSFLSLSALLSAALALVPAIRIPDSYPTALAPWVVTNYNEGCSPGGCVYHFNIGISNSGTNEPEFSTKCTGNNITPDFQSCDDPAIATREVNGFINVTLIVQHYYTEGEARYTVMGNSTIVNPGFQTYNFDIVQSSYIAVA